MLTLPPTLFFSYFPIISLGGNSTMNFELSLPLIWLVLFDLFSLILLIQSRPRLNFKKLWPWLLFPLFLTISIAWSLNPLRGLLTVGVLWRKAKKKAMKALNIDENAGKTKEADLVVFDEEKKPEEIK